MRPFGFDVLSLAVENNITSKHASKPLYHFSKLHPTIGDSGEFRISGHSRGKDIRT